MNRALSVAFSPPKDRIHGGSGGGRRHAGGSSILVPSRGNTGGERVGQRVEQCTGIHTHQPHV